MGLCEASAEDLGGDIPEFAAFVDGAQFHCADEVCGQIEGCFHAVNFPFFQLSGKFEACLYEEILPWFSHQGTEAPRKTPNHQNAPPSQPLSWCLCAFV